MSRDAALPDDIEAPKSPVTARRTTIATTRESLLERNLPIGSMRTELMRLKFMLTPWAALTRYRDDSHIEIDNDTADCSLRAVAPGRKNYPFTGSDAGWERAAAIYSLAGSATLNGLDPEAHLRHLLAHIAEHLINGIEESLPWRVDPQSELAHCLAA